MLDRYIPDPVRHPVKNTVDVRAEAVILDDLLLHRTSDDPEITRYDLPWTVQHHTGGHLIDFARKIFHP